jgi:hypothetical protein
MVYKIKQRILIGFLVKLEDAIDLIFMYKLMWQRWQKGGDDQEISCGFFWTIKPCSNAESK